MDEQREQPQDERSEARDDMAEADLEEAAGGGTGTPTGTVTFGHRGVSGSNTWGGPIRD